MRSTGCNLYDGLNRVYLEKNPKRRADLQPLRDAHYKASVEIYSRYPDMESPILEVSDLPLEIQIEIATAAGV